MTSADREYDDIISRALHAIVDPVEPAGDGLARIRDQISQPWLTRRLSLLMADCLHLAWLVFTWCESALLAGRSRIAESRAALAALGPVRSWPRQVFSGVLPANSRRRHQAAHRGDGARAGGDWAATALVWARPALAVTAAVLVVAAGYYGLGQIRQTIAPSNNTLGSTGNSGPDGGAPITSSQSSTSAQPGPGPSKHGSSLSATPGSGKGTAVPVPCASGVPASPSSSPSPSAVPTVSSTPSSVPTPSAEPTPSDTPTPTDSTPTPAASSDTPSDSSTQDGTAGGDGTQQAGSLLGTGVPLGATGGGTGPHRANNYGAVIGTNVPAMAASCSPTTPVPVPSPSTSPAPIPTPSIPVDSQSSSPPAP